MLHSGLLVFVQVYLDETRTIQLDADSLSHDLSGEAQVLEDVVVDHGQSATEKYNKIMSVKIETGMRS